MIKLDIQMFGGRGSSSSNADTEPKSATFTTATRNMDEDGRREDIEVKGVTFRYKTIDVGVFNSEQEAYAKNRPYLGRAGSSKYVAVVRTNNETNGAMITTGSTRKEAIANAKNIIDERKKQILKAIGR